MSTNEIKFLIGRGAAVSAARVKMWRVCYDKISITLADGDSFFLKPFEKASELPLCSDGAMLAFIRLGGKISAVQLTAETNEELRIKNEELAAAESGELSAEFFCAAPDAQATTFSPKGEANEENAKRVAESNESVEERAAEKCFAERLGGLVGKVFRAPIFIPIAVAAVVFALVRAALHFLSE